MFIYLEDQQVIFAVSKVVKIYIEDDLTTMRVIIEGGQGFDLFHDNEVEANDRLKSLADCLGTVGLGGKHE